ncbi:hypothetical protein WG66_001258 [Moniliophthora roreri]|nr:hypothetical protein WG66_001258 [Moniliophthora roreri]
MHLTNLKVDARTSSSFPFTISVHLPRVMDRKRPQSNPVTNRTLFESYKALPASTRLRFSLAMCVVAATGIAVSDWLEKQIPPGSEPIYYYILLQLFLQHNSF